MEDKDRDALCAFMIRVLSYMHPYHSEYLFQELRWLEESEGEDSVKFRDYSESTLNAYWMKRNIETIRGANIWSTQITKRFPGCNRVKNLTALERKRDKKYNGSTLYFRELTFTFVVQDGCLKSVEISAKGKRGLNK